ncbi:MAG TPA: hypothetical protein PLN21_06375 [Gemmatales bacterium]|nr:hypothetical protein [Gemmatales bacterium]
MLKRSKLSLIAVMCVALLSLQPSLALAQGPSPDKYLPEGADMVVQLNLNQLMGSTLLQKGIPLVVKKYGEDVMNMVSNFVPDDNAKKMMQDLAPELKNKVTEEAVSQMMTMAKGFVKEFVFSANMKEEVNGAPQIVMSLGIPVLTAATVDQFLPLIQGSGQMDVKTHEVDGVTVYEMKPNTAPAAFFMAVPEDGIMVMSITKDILVKTLKSKGKAKVDPKLAELLSQRKNSYTLFVASLAPKNKADELKHFVANLTIDKDINGSAMMVCVDADKAKEHAKEANETFESAVATIVGFADDHPELKPISEALKKVKAEVNGSTINMKLSIKGDDIINAMKASK